MEKVKEFYHRYLIRHTLFRSVSFLLKCLPGGDYIKDVERGGRPGWRRTRPCPKRWRDVRAAVICDDMTWASLQNTGHVVYLTPADWFEKLEEEKPDLLFCEATWSGLSSKDCCWEGRDHSGYRCVAGKPVRLKTDPALLQRGRDPHRVLEQGRPGQ